MTLQILLSIIVSIIGADGELSDVTVIVMDGPVYTKCLSDSGCLRVYDSKIFLNYGAITKTDDCGRTVLYHELAHFKYPKLDIHTECKLNAKVVQWKNTA
jgi:hypothetical protein